MRPQLSPSERQRGRAAKSLARASAGGCLGAGATHREPRLRPTDFDRFVLDLLEPAPTHVVLDIGPGTGKQMLPLAGRVRRILELDVSPES